MLSAQVFLSSKLTKTFIGQFRTQLLAEGKSFTDNRSSQLHHLIRTNKRQHLRTWQSELETEFIGNCEFFWNCEMTRSRVDNQLENRQHTWPSWDFGTFLLLQVLLLQLSWNSCKTLPLLFICLFTHSQASAVLFLLLLCVVLVLYSYQESTLFVKALDPFNYNKSGCNQYQTGCFCFCFFFEFCMHGNVF